jgi:hypothetical protein
MTLPTNFLGFTLSKSKRSVNFLFFSVPVFAFIFDVFFASLLSPFWHPFRINLHASPHPFPHFFVPVPQRVPFGFPLLLLAPLWSPFRTHLVPISLDLGCLWLPPWKRLRRYGRLRGLLMLFGFVNAFPILVNAFPKLLTLTSMGIVNAIWIVNAFPILVSVRPYAKCSLQEPSQMVYRIANYCSHAVHHLLIYTNGDTLQCTETVLDITMHSLETGL